MKILPSEGIRGWLDTSGVCHHVEDTHTDFSAKQLRIKLPPLGTPGFLKAGLDADKKLYDKGWVRIVIKPEIQTLYFDTLNVPWKNLNRHQRGWLYDAATNGIKIEGDKIFPGDEVLPKPLTITFGVTDKNPTPDELIAESTSFFGMLKQVLTERMSFKDLYNASDSGRKHRAAHVRPRPLKVAIMNKKETWTFRYKSSPSTTGNPWHGYIQFFKDSAVDANNAGDIDCIVDCDCFSGDVPVLMKNGTYKPIKDITIGDEIYTHRGRVRRVINTMYRNVRADESTYKIKVSGFPGEMIVTENHPFYTLRGNDYCLCGCKEKIWESVYSHQCSSPTLVLSRNYVKGHYFRPKVENDNSQGLFEWVEAKDLRDHEWFLTPWFEEVKNDFNDINFARLVGYYIAEGCIPSHRGTTVRLTFNIDEWDTLGDDVVKICNKLGYKTVLYKHKTRNCFDVRIQNKSFREFCKLNVGVGSFNKRFSNYIMSWNNDCLKNVFIGAILGDGWIDPDKGMKYISISFNLTTQIATILNKLKIKNNISISNKYIGDTTRHPLYQVIIPRGNSAEIVRNWLYKYLREKDKFISSQENINSINHHRIEGHLKSMTDYEKSSYTGLVYDITVDEDESFITNGIAVHNCPDYRYRFAYNNAKEDAGEIGAKAWNKNNGRPPRSRAQGGVGDYGVGMCVSEGELISTDKGFLPIEMVTKNDKVWTVDGWKQVLNHGMTGEKQIVEIKLKSGRILKITPEHKVFAFSESNGFEWIAAKMLKKSNFLCITLPSNIDVKYETFNINEYIGGKLYYSSMQICLNETMAELMGYMVSEGSVNGIFSNFNLKLIEDFHKKWTSIFGEKSCIIRDGGCNVGRYGGDILKSLGLICGSYEKEVPDWVMRGNKSVIVAFLRGCYAGDGNFRNCHSTYASVSKKLARNIQLLTSFIGVNCSLNCYKSGINKSDTWVVRTSSSEETKKLFGILNPIRGYSSGPLNRDEKGGCHNYFIRNAFRFFEREILKTYIPPLENLLIFLKDVRNYFPWITKSYIKELAKILTKEKMLKKHENTYTNMAYLHDIHKVMGSYYAEKILSKQFIRKATKWKFHKKEIISIIKSIRDISGTNTNAMKLLSRTDISFDAFDELIDRGEYKKVYDLTVDSSEQFTVNGAIVHNCKHLISLAEFLKTKIEPDVPEPEDEVPQSKAVQPAPRITPETPTTTDAPEPDDAYTDSREGGYSDSRDGLQEQKGLLFERIDKFVKTNPQFEVQYE